MKPSNITVIIPVLNGEARLATAIRSVLAQTCGVQEILVVDGGSTDGTEAVARQFEEVTWLQQGGKGLANARNSGLQAATGELIAFHDHDDRWEPHKLEQQVDYLRRHPETDYVITQLKFELAAGCTPTAAYTPQSFKTTHVGCTPSALLARRTLFESFGGFDESFALGCDADWFARARDAGIVGATLPEVLTYKTIHSDNLSANVETNRQELISIVLQSMRRRRQQTQP